MIGWSLENSLVAGLCALLVLLVGWVWRTRPGLQHCLWLAVLGVLLMPKLPFLDTPGGGLRRELRELLPASATSHGAGQPGDIGSLPVATYSASVRDPLLVGSSFDSAPEAGLQPATPASVLSTGSFAWGDAWAKARPWLGAIWLAGALVVLVRSVRRVLAFQRLVQQAAPAEGPLRQEVARVARRFRLPEPEVRLLQNVASPSVWCFGRPVLLWPAAEADPGAVSPASTTRSTLIAHELAHLARRDHWVSWLEIPAAALFWWNPLFWWIRGRIRHFAELSCDAWAVWAYPADRRLYAEALIDLQAKTALAPVAFQGLGATDSELKDFERRLNMIMKQRVSPRVSKGVAAAAACVALLAAPSFSGGATAPDLDGGYAGKKAGAELPAVVLRVKSVELLKKAEKLFKAKEYGEALPLFQQVAELDPENGKAHARLGYILVGKGELAAAEKHFHRHYELGYERSTALYNLGCAKALGGDSKAAVEYVAAAVRHGFDNVKLMKSDYDLASVRETEAFQKQVALAQLAKELNHGLWELAEREDAEAQAMHLRKHAKLAEIRSADGKLQSDHGFLALKRADYVGAAQAFGRQAESGFEVPRALYNSACARSLAGEVEAAVADLARAAEAGMKYPNMVSDTDLDNVRAHARYASLEQKIVKSGANQLKLKGLQLKGDYAAMIPELKAMADDPESSKKGRSWALQELGRAYLAENQPAKALGALEKAAALGTAVDRTAFHMAEAFAALDRDEDALQHVEYALRLGYAQPAPLRTFLEEHSLAVPEKIEELVNTAAAKAKAYAEEKGYGAKQKAAWSAEQGAKPAEGAEVAEIVEVD